MLFIGESLGKKVLCCRVALCLWLQSFGTLIMLSIVSVEATVHFKILIAEKLNIECGGGNLSWGASVTVVSQGFVFNQKLTEIVI